ncbi:MAG: hypothetical protein JXD19_06725 [Deltaproteobacteria bacterium]|nr:hypothetical protein [Deltaproteobacteria bacterium]
MIIRWILMFSLISFGFAVFTILNYWQIDHVGARVILGYRCKPAWSFWGMFAILATPALIFTNVLFWAVYYYAYHFWFKKLWIIQVTAYGAGLMMVALITWAWYSEIPSKGTLVGIALCMAGALTSILWK